MNATVAGRVSYVDMGVNLIRTGRLNSAYPYQITHDLGNLPFYCEIKTKCICSNELARRNMFFNESIIM